MRKIAVLLTLLMLTLLMLTATLFFVCSEINNGTSPESETEEPQSEDLSSEILSSEESLKEELSSEISSEAVSSEEEDKPRLNEDLLSDIGLTYPELVKKRGKLVEVFEARGGICYVFENGYGAYAWSDPEDIDYGKKLKETKNYTPMPRDDNKKIIVEKAFLPKSNIIPITMDWVKTPDLFLGLSTSIKAIEIEEKYNIKHNETQNAGGFDGWDYVSSFSYKNARIHIYTNKEGMIDVDSQLVIWSSRKEI